MVFKSFDILRQAGFDNVNLDLMFAIPGQTLEIWRDTLNEAIAMGSEHLSSYEVIYEEDTALYAQLTGGRIRRERGTWPAACTTMIAVERAGPAGFAIRDRQLRANQTAAIEPGDGESNSRRPSRTISLPP